MFRRRLLQPHAASACRAGGSFSNEFDTGEFERCHDLGQAVDDAAHVAVASLHALDRRDRRVVAESIRYAGYVERQRRDAERVKKAGRRSIPDGFVFRGLSGLSNEIVEKLEAVRPETIGRAARIDGMTPAALAILAAHVEAGARV